MSDHVNLYETRRLVDEYLLFHYGADHEILPWDGGPVSALRFPLRTVTELLPSCGNLSGNPDGLRALDVGCAVGRSAFELSKVCAEVVGIDYSHAFIQAAASLQTGVPLPYQIAREAHLTEPLVARLPENGTGSGGLPGDIHPERISFRQGDAMNLPEDLGTFDIVHAANLICRLTEPLRFLQRLPSLIRPGGHLLLTTPCTWLAEFTPPDRWPTGTTLDWLTETLSPHFDLIQKKDLPFLIREHARKFQWSMALGTVWQRK
ncbi:MAG: uncharacterized protein JWL81_824 [Verrucomicrobiales bacterium]|nr:uncharacterized protein [Verrucomicrobiales bacterium]